MSERYKFYTDGTGRKVICVTHFAGKPVRAEARCHENDTFDKELGEKLSRARVDLNVAILRLKKNQKNTDEAWKTAERAIQDWLNAKERLKKAETEWKAADTTVVKILNEITAK